MSLRYLSSYRFVSHAWIRLAHKPASSSPLPFSYIRSPLCCAVLSRVQLGDCMDWARQAPLSMDRQDYWGGLPFPSPGGLSGPGFKPTSPASPALLVNSFFFFCNLFIFFIWSEFCRTLKWVYMCSPSLSPLPTGEFFTTVPSGKPQISGVHSSHKWWQIHLSFWNLIKTLHRNRLYGARSNYLYNFEQLIFPQERRQVKLHICPHLETLCMFSSIEKTDVHISRDSFSSGRGLASVFRYLIT